MKKYHSQPILPNKDSIKNVTAGIPFTFGVNKLQDYGFQSFNNVVYCGDSDNKCLNVITIPDENFNKIQNGRS